MSIWNDVATLQRLARWAPYAFIVLGFLAALFGQFARFSLDSRIARLKAEALLAHKHTPPDMDAYLATSDRTGDLLLVIDAKNLIPFRASWTVVTEKHRIVTGIMLQDQEIRPTEERKRFSAKVEINQKQVVNEFIELRFRYESMYLSEVGNPPELRGQIVHRYRLSDNKAYPWGS